MTKIRLSDVLWDIQAFRDLINFLETVRIIALENESTELKLIHQHIIRNITMLTSKEIEVEKYLNDKKNGSTQIYKNSK